MDIEFELISNEIAKVMVEFLKLTEPDVGKKVNRTAIDMLKEIKVAVCDKKLTDFEVVENIVCLFEKNNFDCGGRHDF